MSQSREQEGFVVGNKGSAYYVYSRTSTRDIILDYRYCDPNVDLIGKWIRGRMTETHVCGKVEVIEDVFESRVLRGLCEMKVEVQHDGVADNKFEMFYNNYVGYVCDPRRIIPNVQRNAFYEIWIVRHIENGINSRWRVSTAQDNLNPCSDRSNVSDRGGTVQNRLEEVEGFVHSYSKNSRSFFAWSPSHPKKTIRLDDSLCFSPPNTPVIGRWIDMTIDDSFKVHNEIRLINDLYETRIRNGIPEIRVDFQHVENMRNGFKVFENRYFGTIVDMFDTMRNVENGAWYNGWIAHDRQNEIKSLWRLAIDQTIVGPLRNSSRDQDSSYHSHPPRGDDHWRDARPRSPESFGRTSRASDRGHLNRDFRDRDYYSPDRDNRQRSPDRRPSPTRDYSRRRNDSRTPDRPRPDNERPPSHQNAHKPRSRKDTDVSSDASRASTTSEEDQWDQVGSSDEDDGQKQNNRSYQSARPSSRTSSRKAAEQRAGSAAKKAAPEVLPWNPHANMSTKSKAAPVPVPTATKKEQRTEKERRFLILQTSAGRLADFFEDFAAQKEINDLMRLQNLDQYTEGLGLVEKIRNLNKELSK